MFFGDLGKLLQSLSHYIDLNQATPPYEIKWNASLFVSARARATGCCQGTGSVDLAAFLLHFYWQETEHFSQI